MGKCYRNPAKFSPQLLRMMFSYIFQHSLSILINCFFVSWISEATNYWSLLKSVAKVVSQNSSKFMEFHLHPSGVMKLLIPILGESNKQCKSNCGNFEGISLITIHYLLVGGFQHFLFSTPTRGNDPI